MGLDCFIAYPTAIDTSVIRRALNDLDVKTKSEFEFSTDTSISESVQKAISKSDFVIGVLNPLNNDQVIFELGFAKALGLPILIISPPNIDDLPFFLDDFTLVNSKLDDYDAIYYNLEQLTNHLLNKKYKIKLFEPKKPVSNEVSITTDIFLPMSENYSYDVEQKSKDFEFITYLQNKLHKKSMITGMELEHIVKELLQGIGVDVVVQPESDGKRADFAIWDKKIGPWVGNPLLIEVKTKLNSVTVNKIINSVSNFYKKRTPPYWTLVLFLDDPSDIDGINVKNKILFLRIDEFFDQLKEKNFASVIRNLRRSNRGNFYD